jgi:hypothetical protein
MSHLLSGGADSGSGSEQPLKQRATGPQIGQMGFGVLESWNLHPLDSEGSLRPEAASLPLIGKRHAEGIAYGEDSRRIAVLDDTGGVTIFKVSSSEGPSLQEGLRIAPDVLTRLAPRTRRLDLTRFF